MIKEPARNLDSSEKLALQRKKLDGQMKNKFLVFLCFHLGMEDEWTSKCFRAKVTISYVVPLPISTCIQ